MTRQIDWDVELEHAQVTEEAVLEELFSIDYEAEVQRLLQPVLRELDKKLTYLRLVIAAKEFERCFEAFDRAPTGENRRALERATGWRERADKAYNAAVLRWVDGSAQLVWHIDGDGSTHGEEP